LHVLESQEEDALKASPGGGSVLKKNALNKKEK
jgi:hypothetical protein